MRKVNPTGKDIKLVKHARSEEDALPRVVGRVGRQFALRQLQDGMSLIHQTELRLDLPENADSVVDDRKLGDGCVLA